jgi:histidine triad (HIT) family protein
MQDCIFCSLIRREEESSIVYEDDRTIAFLPRKPNSPGHTLLMPKTHYADIFHAPPGEVLYLLQVAARIVAAIRKTFDPPRVGVIAMGLVVPHAHFHLMPIHSPDDITSRAELEGRLVTYERAALDAMASSLIANLGSDEAPIAGE